MEASDLRKLRGGFMNPPEDYGAIPWWCWTGDLAEDELERQMRSMKEQGLSQFFIFAYGPQDVEYLSEEWFGRVGFMIEKARELGMKAWIYDELDWPSGTAGGRVTAHREYRARALAEFDATSTGAGAVELCLPLGQMKDARLEHVFAAPAPDGRPAISESVDLTAQWSPGPARETVVWDAPGAGWMLMALVSFTPDGQTFQGHYVDLLNPEATRCFIRHTHQAYYDRFGEHFGAVIPGFFMDECFYMSTVHGDAELVDAPMAPWTPKLEEELAARGLERPEQYWWAVFHDVGAETARLRLREKGVVPAQPGPACVRCGGLLPHAERVRRVRSSRGSAPRGHGASPIHWSVPRERDQPDRIDLAGEPHRFRLRLRRSAQTGRARRGQDPCG